MRICSMVLQNINSCLGIHQHLPSLLLFIQRACLDQKRAHHCFFTASLEVFTAAWQTELWDQHRRTLININLDCFLHFYHQTRLTKSIKVCSPLFSVLPHHRASFPHRETIHNFWAVSSSKERGNPFYFSVVLTLPPRGVAITQSSFPRSWRRSSVGRVRTVAAADGLSNQDCHLCKPADTHHTLSNSQRISHDKSHKRHSMCVCVWVSRCVCVCMNVIHWYPVLYWPPMLSGKQKRRLTARLFFSTHLLLLLSVLGKCLSFSEYLCILWHDTEVKFV